MAKVKAITTIIEDEVVFMTDPKVEYVSLVKHGANRTPFKVFKSEKEDNAMNKVVQSILVKNDLPKEKIDQVLEGMSKKSATSFKTFTSYPQFPLAKCVEDSFMVVKHSEVEGVFVVLADLVEGESEKGTIQMEAKEAVDYATLDNLYMELYAMADVVSGTLRQENAGVEFRKSTILAAIDNFRTYAEVILSSMDSAKADAIVNPSDHPNLLYPFIKTEKADVKEEVADPAPADPAPVDPAATPDPSVKEEEPNPVAEVLKGVTEGLTQMTASLSATLKEISSQITESNKAVKEELTKLGNAPIASKSEKEEDIDTGEPEGKKVFKGVLFAAK